MGELRPRTVRWMLPSHIRISFREGAPNEHTLQIDELLEDSDVIQRRLVVDLTSDDIQSLKHAIDAYFALVL